MAKGIGLIGNFRGKVGNMVTYNLKDSNNKQNQGVRVYQPIVKNPKTLGQANQRVIMAPVNATYRSLKSIIDRGQESKAYGNKSRLAWLKEVMKNFDGAWFEKGAKITHPAICQLTKGNLPGIAFAVTATGIDITANGTTANTAVATIADVTAALMAAYPGLQIGDQVTFVTLSSGTNGMVSDIYSIILSSADTTAVTRFAAAAGKLTYTSPDAAGFGAVIVSREGANGKHLRSTASLGAPAATLTAAPYDAASKTAAIASYRSSSMNSDWAEESVQ